MEENAVRSDNEEAAPQPRRIAPPFPGSAHKRSPALAAFLSLFPGFGHLYNGEIGKALVFFSAFATCIFVLSDTNGGNAFFGLMIPFIVFYNMIEAYRSAERINLQSLSGQPATDEPSSNRLWGWALVVMGGLLLLHNLGLFRFEWVAKLWPLLLIAAGFALLRGTIWDDRR